MTTAAAQRRPLPTERRNHNRAMVGRLVHFETAGGLLTATVQELSEAGMRLETPWVPPMHSELQVHLPLTSRSGKVTHCVIKGRVVRQRDEEIGVAFTDLLPRHMLQLRDFVWRSDGYCGPQ